MHPTRITDFRKICNIFWLGLCFLIDARSLYTKHMTYYSYTTSDILNNYHSLEFYSHVGNTMRKLWDVVGFSFLFESFLRFRWYTFSISMMYYSIRGGKKILSLDWVFSNCIQKVPYYIMWIKSYIFLIALIWLIEILVQKYLLLTSIIKVYTSHMLRDTWQAPTVPMKIAWLLTTPNTWLTDHTLQLTYWIITTLWNSIWRWKIRW
jgi:hypothetical protein